MPPVADESLLAHQDVARVLASVYRPLPLTARKRSAVGLRREVGRLRLVHYAVGDELRRKVVVVRGRGVSHAPQCDVAVGTVGAEQRCEALSGRAGIYADRRVPAVVEA